MEIKVKGSYELLRDFCKAVKVGVLDEINHAATSDMKLVAESLIEMFHMNASCLAQKYPIPLNHIEVYSEDEFDDEMVEWIKNEPLHLAEVVYLHFAEKILNYELQKIESQQAA